MIKYFIILLLIVIFVLLFFTPKLNTNKLSWTNWAHNQACSPLRIVAPKTKEELIDVIKQAYRENKRIHAAGSGHSWSDIVCTDGYLFDFTHLNQIIEIDIKNKTAHVQAGITIKALNEQVHSKGLALPNQGAVMVQTIAGITATATHGSGKTGSFSSFITEINLITVDGQELTITKQNPEAFAAACTNIGCLGIIYAIKLQCIDQFRLSEKSFDVPISEVLRTYEQLRKQHDFFSFTYLPLTDRAHIVIRDKTADTSAEVGYLVLSSLEDEKEGSRLEEEVGIPVQNLPAALKLLKTLIQKYQTKEGRPGEVVCRFVNAEPFYLSPAFGRDTVFLSISTPPNSDQWAPFFKEFGELLFPLQGRPHWGKINFVDYEKAKILYGDAFIKFNAVRKKLDPENRLFNIYYEKIFIE